MFSFCTKALFCFAILSLLTFSSPTTTLAQSTNTSQNANVEGAATMGVAQLVVTKNKNIKDGSIISTSRSISF